MAWLCIIATGSIGQLGSAGITLLSSLEDENGISGLKSDILNVNFLFLTVWSEIIAIVNDEKV